MLRAAGTDTVADGLENDHRTKALHIMGKERMFVHSTSGGILFEEHDELYCLSVKAAQGRDTGYTWKSITVRAQSR